MVSEAQRRATAKYEAGNMRQVLVKFYRPDFDLVEWMDENGYKGAWVKGLIRREFESRKNEKDA